jgi:2',3'-cyclic-nucleotide 2'-phosphodiesterase (5'-nucleotidase family)
MRKAKALAAAIGWLCGAALALAAIPRGTAVPNGLVQTPEKSLVLLFTHDLHSSFLPRRTILPGGLVAERGGWAKIATLVRGEREAGPDRTLAVDAGDFSMGTLFMPYSSGKPPSCIFWAKWASKFRHSAITNSISAWPVWPAHCARPSPA